MKSPEGEGRFTPKGEEEKANVSKGFLGNIHGHYLPEGGEGRGSIYRGGRAKGKTTGHNPSIGTSSGEGSSDIVGKQFVSPASGQNAGQ